MGGGTEYDSVDGGYDYPDIPENPGESEGDGNEPTEPEKPETPNPKPDEPNPDEPSASYKSESDILKKILTEETYSTYAAESESSVMLTQETIISSADIFLEITALVGTSESIENIQTRVNGATEYTKKALVAMAEGTISIEKNGMKELILKNAETNSISNYSPATPTVYEIVANSNIHTYFSGDFDYSKVYLVMTDASNADFSNAELFILNKEQTEQISLNTLTTLRADLDQESCLALPSLNFGIYL